MTLSQRQQNQIYEMIQCLQKMNTKMNKDINIQTRDFQSALISSVNNRFKAMTNILKEKLKKLQLKEFEKQEQENVQEMQEKQILMSEKQSDKDVLNEQSNMLSLIMTQNNHTLQIRDQKNQSKNQINSKQISMQNSQYSQLLSKNWKQLQNTKLHNVQQIIQNSQYTLMLGDISSKVQLNLNQEKTQKQRIQMNSQTFKDKQDPWIDFDNLSVSDIQNRQNKTPQQQIKQMHTYQRSYEKFKKLSDQQSNPWIKRISDKEQGQIFMIDLTEFKQDQNNAKQLKMYLNTYRDLQQRLRPIFIVQKIKLKSNFDQQLLKQILSINWNGLKQIILQNNKYWYNKMKKKQLRQFLQLADLFSKKTSLISIVIQFRFVSSSYLKVIQEMDLTSQLILKVQYLNQKHQKILRKGQFKAVKKIILQFKVSNKNSKTDIMVAQKLQINLEILQEFEIDQEIGYEESCLVEYDNETLKNKYKELKTIFLSVISHNKVSIQQQQKEQSISSTYQILENGNFKLNLFFSFDLQTIFKQFNWNQIQVIHFTKIISYDRFEMQYSLEQLDCKTLALFKHLKYVLIDIELLRNKQVQSKLINIMKQNSLQYLDEKAFQKIYQYNSKQSSIPIIVLENDLSMSLIDMNPEKNSIKKYKTFNQLKLHYMQKGYKFQQQKQIIVKQPQIQPKKQVYSKYIDNQAVETIQKSWRNLEKGLQKGQYSPCSIY